jgi:hypothetical protein
MLTAGIRAALRGLVRRDRFCLRHEENDDVDKYYTRSRTGGCAAITAVPALLGVALCKRLMSAHGIVSRVTPVQMGLPNCTRDEGRPFEVGNQVLVSSHRKLLSSKAMVVNVRKSRNEISAGMIERGERKRTADESRRHRTCQLRASHTSLARQVKHG